MIIGLTGKNAAGKGEAARYLTERGFLYCSLSDLIRDELKTQGREVDRQALVEEGNLLRRRFGPSVLAERLLAIVQPDRNYVVDSIRNPAEVEALRRRDGFLLVSVVASSKRRFERITARAREKDPISFEEFQRLEAQEGDSDEATNQLLEQTQRCQPDFILVNDGPLEELHDQIRDLLVKATKTFKRPDWDEYFMEIAKVVALRGNCVKRKVACVVVKDRRIISTGYNGTPRGIKNCYEGGCPRCIDFEKAGTRLDECFCSHAEENAITQAAYHGVSIKDSAVYTTFSPCLMCTKMIINSGIHEVVYSAEYTLSEVSLNLLKEAGVVTRQITMPT